MKLENIIALSLVPVAASVGRSHSVTPMKEPISSSVHGTDSVCSSWSVAFRNRVDVRSRSKRMYHKMRK